MNIRAIGFFFIARNLGICIINFVVLSAISAFYFYYKFSSVESFPQNGVSNIIFRAAQDFGVGCILLAYANLIVWRQRKMPFWIKLLLYIIPVITIFYWSIVDLFLAKYSGYRLEPAYIIYFIYAREFIFYKDLNPQVVISLIVLLTITISGLNIVGLACCWRRDKLSLKVNSCLLFIPLTIGVVYCFESDYSYECNANPLYKIAFDSIKRRIHTVSIDEATRILKKSLPKNDISTILDENYPLYKITHGFSGRQLMQRLPCQKMPQHVIIIFWESVRGINVGSLGRSKYSLTPCFDKLSSEGILFKNFYATGVHTSRGVLSALYGILPFFSPFSVQESFSGIRLCSLPSIFQEKGYETAYFFPGPIDFCNQKYFFSKNGIKYLYGNDTIGKVPFPGNCPSWNVFDYRLMQYCSKWIKDRDAAGDKTFMVINTTSNHIPIRVEAGMQPPRCSFQEYYVRSLNWSDRSIYDYIQSLKKNGIYDKSLIVIIGDHGCAIGDHPKVNIDRNQYEESILVPMLIICPQLINHPVIIKSVGSQIDLMPTLFDLLEIKDVKNHFQGRSLLRESKSAKAFFSCAVTSYPAGLRVGNWKYVYRFETGIDELFDLSHDLAERHNLADQFPDLVRKFRKDVIDVNAMNTTFILKNRLVPPRASTYNKCEQTTVPKGGVCVIRTNGALP